jgi:prepilin-type processing-associated H-X9-DG protein
MFRLFAVLLVAVVVIQCLGFDIHQIELFVELLVGWVDFLRRVLPQVHVRWDLVASALFYAAVLVAGSHAFLRWLYREMSGPCVAGGSPSPGAWRLRWTLGGFAIIALMFTAGMAAIGVAHQTAWLVTSREPLFRRVPGANRMKCASNLRQIGLACLMYANDHGGKFPDDFKTVLLNEDITSEIFVCPASNDERAMGNTPEATAGELEKPGHCSYIYFGKGLTNTAGDATVIAVEPLENHDGVGINVLYADGHVEWRERAAAEALLMKLGFVRVEIAPAK